MKFILSLLLTGLFVSVSTGKQTKILFLGNSYTAQSARFIKEVFNRNGGSYELQFGTSGGKDLHFHLTNPASQKALHSTKWDFVVIGSKPKARTWRPIYPRLSCCGERTLQGHRKTGCQTLPLYDLGKAGRGQAQCANIP